MMHRFLSLLIITLLLSACVGGARMPPDNQIPKGNQGGIQKVGKPYKIGGVWYHPENNPYYDEVGNASWYGKQFHGRKTANGETYNMNALTAAHKTLPMPTYVKVTNLANGRSVILRVNDRGPFVAGRVIDVSRRGAQLLGFQQKGVTRVRVQAVDENGRVRRNPNKNRRQKAKMPPTNDTRGHFVQVGAFANLTNAVTRKRQLDSVGQNARIVEGKSGNRTLFRVRVGPFNNLTKAETILEKILALGFYDARLFKLK